MVRVGVKLKNPLIAGGAVAALMLGLFAAAGFYPFGDKCISWCDMNQQVVPLLMDFKDVLAGRDGMFLSMANAGGMNFWGVFFFFLSSPFSFLVAFVPKADMMSFMNLLVTLKMAVAAGTACLFFERQFRHNGRAVNIALGFAYGMCGYAMHYFQNIIWLDMMYLFPLLMIALERLYEDDRPLMYIVTLTLMMAVNYYIGYMLVIFLLLASGAYLLWRAGRERCGEVMLRFAVSSVLAALLSAPVWLPSLMQYWQTARTQSLLESLAGGSVLPHFQTTWPLLYCTPVIFAALPFLRRTASGERAGRRYWLALFALTVVPQLMDPINKMWHTGSYMSFPYRYGFMAVFCGLTLVSYAVGAFRAGGRDTRLAPRSPADGLAAAVVALAALVISGAYLMLRRGEALSAYTRTLWGTGQSFRLLTLYFIEGLTAFAAIFLLMRFKKLSAAAFRFFLCAMLIMAGVFNFRVYMGSVSQDASGFRAAAMLEGKIEDGGFYRVKAERKIFDVNMMGAAGYASLSHYTSLTSEDYMFAMKRLGYSSYWMEVNSDGGTFFSDALLANRYTVTYASVDYPGRRLAATGRFGIYQNEITLPAALFSGASPEALRELPPGGRLERQDALFKALLGRERGIITRYEPRREESGALYYTVSVTDRQALYFDCFDRLSNDLSEPVNDSYRVRVNGEVIAESYPTQRGNGILYLGVYEDTDVEIELEILKRTQAESLGVYGMDMNALGEAALAAGGADISVRGNAVQLAFDAHEDGYLYLPLPYLDGYALTVNGAAAEPYRVLGAFMAVAVSAGENAVVLRFTPPGLYLGLALFALGAALVTSYLRLRRRAGARVRAALGRVACAAAVLVIAGVFAAVYVFPTVYYLFSRLAAGT